ncbi:MAG TPA: hypothetical protein VH396_11615 [Chitinophagaceae bacterium]|jgi:hypothetical protein
MKNKTCIATVAAIIFMSVGNVTCSKDGGDDFFIPILENAWFNKDNPDDIFQISGPAQDSVNSSTFTGTEDSAFVVSYAFTGSFTNHNIQFTYDNNSGVKSGKTYSGTINDASTVMTLHNNDLGDLVLQKP